MKLPTLRDYQQQIVYDVYSHVRRGNKRVLVAAATGAGKTHTIGKMVYDAVNAGRQVMVTVNRDALINQAVKTFSQWGLSSGVVSGRHKENRFPPVQVCSFQSLGRDRDLSWLNPGFVVSDEAHSTSWSTSMLQRFPKLESMRPEQLEKEVPYVGLTATPWRSDPHECMGDIFPVMVKAPSYKELIAMGNLVQPVYYEVPGSHGKCMLADVEYIIDQYRKYGQNSLAFVFTESIPFAKKVAEIAEGYEIPSVAIHEGISPKRRDIYFEEAQEGKIKILTTCLALVEGVDIPRARVAILARNAYSPAFYFQAVGRIMRPYTYPDGDKKTDCIVLDQMGIVQRFGRVENLVISDADLYDAKPYQDNEFAKPVKQCPRCEKFIHASTMRCTCGYSFDRVGKERYSPTEDMHILWENDKQKIHYAQYQRMLRIACEKQFPFQWADQSFLETYGYFAPHDWRRNAIVPPGDEVQAQKFLEYLEAIAKEQNKSALWVSRQMSLELGI